MSCVVDKNLSGIVNRLLELNSSNVKLVGGTPSQLEIIRRIDGNIVDEFGLWYAGELLPIAVYKLHDRTLLPLPRPMDSTTITGISVTDADMKSTGKYISDILTAASLMPEGIEHQASIPTSRLPHLIDYFARRMIPELS